MCFLRASSLSCSSSESTKCSGFAGFSVPALAATGGCEGKGKGSSGGTCSAACEGTGTASSSGKGGTEELAALLEKAPPLSERLREVLKEVLVPFPLVVPGEELELVAGSVGASPGAPAAGRPVITGIAYASSAPALRGTLQVGCCASVGPLLVAESSTVEGGVAIASKVKQ